MDMSAEQYIYLIKEKIKYENRFFIDEEFNKILDILCNDKQLITNIKEDTILYRARIYNKSDKYKKYRSDYKKDEKFFGFNAEESFVLKDKSKVKDGRCNPSFIPYLYTSKDIETAIKETRPYVYSVVSVSEIRVKENLKLLDLSKTYSIDYDKWILQFKLDINLEISLPYHEGGDYQLSQYISEYIKNKGFDGIMYRSAYVSISKKVLEEKGVNITVFNYNKCESVSSELYRVDEIETTYESLKG